MDRKIFVQSAAEVECENEHRRVCLEQRQTPCAGRHQPSAVSAAAGCGFQSKQDRSINRRRGRWSRIRHLRGHGIHSPFVYSIIREAFMKRAVLGDGRLYSELIEGGVRKKAARQLNNLCVHCASQGHEITAVLKPYGGLNLPKEDRLTIENRFFFVIFNSDQLPKQHFRI